MRATAWSRRLDLTASGSGRGRSAASLRWAPEGPVRPVPAAPRVLRVGLSSCAWPGSGPCSFVAATRPS